MPSAADEIIIESQKEKKNKVKERNPNFLYVLILQWIEIDLFHRMKARRSIVKKRNCLIIKSNQKLEKVFYCKRVRKTKSKTFCKIHAPTVEIRRIKFKGIYSYFFKRLEFHGPLRKVSKSTVFSNNGQFLLPAQSSVP